MKYKRGLFGVTMALLIAGMMKMARSDDKPANDLSPQEIRKKAQDTYDSLTSYSDKGKYISIDKGIIDSDIVTIITFTTKLARPNLYRIEWEMTGKVAKQKITVWSAGEGDFSNIIGGPQKQAGRGPQKQASLVWALGNSGGYSTGTIPGAFFKIHMLNLLDLFEDSGLNEKREGDDKVDDMDCYVFSKELSNHKITLWIGKRDFLIHQSRKESINQAKNPEPVNIISTETHSDIVVNQNYLPTDFAP